MEPIKEALNELSRKLDRGDLATTPKEDQAQLIYNEALRRAVSLRIEAELEAIRLHNLQLDGDGAAHKRSTPRDFLRVLFRHQGAILATFAAVMLTVWLGLQLRTPVYQTQVKMLIEGEKEIGSPYYKDISGYRNEPINVTQSEIVNSRPVIDRTVEALGLDKKVAGYEIAFASPLKRKLLEFQRGMLNHRLARLTPAERHSFLVRLAEQDLRSNIKVEPIRDTSMFAIHVKDFDPEAAARKANVLSRAFVIFDLEQQLAELELKYGDKNLAVLELKDNIDRVKNNLSGASLPNLEAIGPASVKVIEQAQVPIEPAGIPRSAVLLAALAAGLLLGVILAFAFEYLDQTLKTPEDAERFLSLPVLGSVTRKRFFDKVLIKDAKRASPYTRSYQNLCDHLYVVMRSKNLKFLLFAAAASGEGVSTILANLGTYFAYKAQLNVLLIDANLRDPGLHKTFSIANNFGLADVLEGKLPFDKVVQVLGSNLSVLTAGRTALNPITLFDSPEMSELVKTAQQRYDAVFIDCAQLKHFRDACVLSSYSDGVVLVVNENRTRRQVIKSALAPLEQRSANLVGSIFNNRTFVVPRAIYERV